MLIDYVSKDRELSYVDAIQLIIEFCTDNQDRQE